MKKIFLVALTVLSLISCEEPKVYESTIHGDIKVEFLFEKDGCKMYRFYNDSRYVYWANCEGMIHSDYTTGGKVKTTVRRETITTK